MTNPEIADAFDRIGDLLEFKGTNPFRIRAYRKAARVLRDLPESVAAILADDARSLTELDGVGADLAEKISLLAETGTLPLLDELLAEVPESALAMMHVSGLGPKRAAVLYKELGVVTLDGLRAACEARQVQAVKGFGSKLEAMILSGIGMAERSSKRMLWALADRHVDAVLKHMHECPAVARIEPSGSYRRGRETVGDLDFLVVADDSTAVMDHFDRFRERKKTLLRGDTKMSIRLKAGLQVDLRVVREESFGAAWQYFTGSQAHNVELRGRAKRAGLKINEYGVYRDEEPIAGRTEAKVYAALDLPCFPPELREARREFDWADAGELPRLIELVDLRGDLHMHTTYSDGHATIEQMAEAARARGLDYVAITDHSKRVGIANGMNEEQFLQQWAEIDRLNAELDDFTILKGAEVDILEQGGLDLPDDVLAAADWIVASVHYGQNQPRDRITGRVLDALANPHVRVLAHPTGRMLQRRKPMELDLEAVIRAATEHGKMLELNAHPIRLDLDDVACAAAKAHGAPVVISTDSHRLDGLEAMRYGVQQARRGGLTRDDVANTRSWPKLRELFV